MWFKEMNLFYFTLMRVNQKKTGLRSNQFERKSMRTVETIVANNFLHSSKVFRETKEIIDTKWNNRFEINDFNTSEFKWKKSVGDFVFYAVEKELTNS